MVNEPVPIPTKEELKRLYVGDGSGKAAVIDRLVLQLTAQWGDLGTEPPQED